MLLRRAPKISLGYAEESSWLSKCLARCATCRPPLLSLPPSPSRSAVDLPRVQHHLDGHGHGHARFCARHLSSQSSWSPPPPPPLDDAGQQGRRRRRSPYAVLGLRPSDETLTLASIKAAFRTLAKRYHPDLRPRLGTRDGTDGRHDHITYDRMWSEVLEAYETLTGNEFGLSSGRALGGMQSRVALACEMYTVSEMRMDRWHDVHDVRLDMSALVHHGGDYDDYFASFETGSEGSGSGSGSESGSESGTPQPFLTSNTAANARDGAGPQVGSSTASLPSRPILSIAAHPHDSVSDLKRSIQTTHGPDWGLTGRRKDRDGLFVGWELVAEIEITAESKWNAEQGEIGGGERWCVPADGFGACEHDQHVDAVNDVAVCRGDGASPRREDTETGEGAYVADEAISTSTSTSTSTKTTTTSTTSVVMAPHLFLSDYRLGDGHIVHAVVRGEEEENEQEDNDDQ